MKIIDKQVFDAMQVVRDELKNWRLLPMGDGYARIIRSPPILSPVTDPNDTGDQVVEWFEVSGTETEIKKQFDDRRTFAALKKSMESFCARVDTTPKA